MSQSLSQSLSQAPAQPPVLPHTRSQNIWVNYQAPCNQSIPAYIVHSESWGEFHRHVIFLSPQYGLLSAFLYGAVSKRNHLRGTVQAFSFGLLTLKQGRRSRQNPRLEIGDWHLEAPSIVLNPPPCTEVYQHVTLWSELLLYSHGLGLHDRSNPTSPAAGQNEPALLFAELRSLLSSVLFFASPAHCQLATLRFFWQFLLLEGFQPGLGQCHCCDAELGWLANPIFFSERSELLCARCARARNGHYLSWEEQNLLCWAEQDLASFVHQDEFFFGEQSQHYSQVGQAILQHLRANLERLLGRSLRSAES